MSRTDKQRPHHLLVREHPIEHHDHRDGVCDLAVPAPDRPTDWKPGRCHLGPAWWRPELRCGCAMCDGPHADRRADRRAGRRDAAARWREHDEDARTGR